MSWLVVFLTAFVGKTIFLPGQLLFFLDLLILFNFFTHLVDEFIYIVGNLNRVVVTLLLLLESRLVLCPSSFAGPAVIHRTVFRLVLRVAARRRCVIRIRMGTGTLVIFKVSRCLREFFAWHLVVTSFHGASHNLIVGRAVSLLWGSRLLVFGLRVFRCCGVGL